MFRRDFNENQRRLRWNYVKIISGAATVSKERGLYCRRTATDNYLLGR